MPISGWTPDNELKWQIWVNKCRSADCCIHHAVRGWHQFVPFMVNQSLGVIYTWHSVSTQIRIFSITKISSHVTWQMYHWGAVILDVFYVIQPLSLFLAPSVLRLARTSHSPLSVCSSSQLYTHSHTHIHKHSHTHIHALRHSTDPCSTAGRLRLPVSASPKTYPEQQWYYSISSRLRLASSALNPPCPTPCWAHPPARDQSRWETAA